jgi:hypothetical protein
MPFLIQCFTIFAGPDSLKIKIQKGNKMTKIRIKTDSTAWIMQWAARVISTVLVLFLAMMGFGQALDEGDFDFSGPESYMGLVIVAYVFVYLVAVVIAWFRERTGGMLLVVLGSIAIIFFMLTEKPEDYWVTLIIGAPFVISGIFYLMCWKRIQKAKGIADQNENTNPI